MALVACVCGDVSHLGYDYHGNQPMNSYLPPAPPSAAFMEPSNMYLPPAPMNQYIPPAPVMAPRQTYIPPRPIMAPLIKPNNDYLPPMVPQSSYIPPAPKNTYIPPTFKSETVMAPRNTYVPPAPVAPRNSYIPPAATPMNTYLPPNESSFAKKHIITPPAPRLEDLIAPQPPQKHYEDSEVFTDDGYKTVRKHKY